MQHQLTATFAYDSETTRMEEIASVATMTAGDIVDFVSENSDVKLVRAFVGATDAQIAEHQVWLDATAVEHLQRVQREFRKVAENVARLIEQAEAHPEHLLRFAQDAQKTVLWNTWNVRLDEVIGAAARADALRHREQLA